MKKFEITEEQIKELAKGNKKVEKMFPEVFETKFELNNWYKIKNEPDNKSLVFFNKIREKKLSGFGFIYNGKWDDEITTYRNFYELELATEEEVKSALIKEAERRGFKSGAKFKSASSGDIFEAGNSEDLILFQNLQTLSYPMGCIFKDGIWADIVKTKYLTKKQAEEELTKVKNDGYEYKIID